MSGRTDECYHFLPTKRIVNRLHFPHLQSSLGLLPLYVESFCNPSTTFLLFRCCSIQTIATYTEICTTYHSDHSTHVKLHLICAPSYTDINVRNTFGHGFSPRSFFGARSFGRRVVTHSLAGFNFHDHRPTVLMSERPSDLC